MADSGNPHLLQLAITDATRFRVGDVIVTADGQTTQGASFFPANVPVGVVQSVPVPGDTTGTVVVTPSVDPSTLGTVQVLTKVPR